MNDQELHEVAYQQALTARSVLFAQRNAGKIDSVPDLATVVAEKKEEIKPRTMQTETVLEQKLADIISGFCDAFLSNIGRYEKNTGRYKRDEATGVYHWAYQGYRMFVPLKEEDHLILMELGFYQQGEYWGVPLNINGKLIGYVQIDIPPAYPRNFLILNFTPEMQYRPSVIVQFARYAGYDPVDLDREKLLVGEDEILLFGDERVTGRVLGAMIVGAAATLQTGDGPVRVELVKIGEKKIGFPRRNSWKQIG